LRSVGRGIAVGSDRTKASRRITPRRAAAVDVVGDEIELSWAEDSWVLAAAPVGSDPDRIQDLLLHLVEVGTALERSPDQAPPSSTSSKPSTASTASTSSTSSTSSPGSASPGTAGASQPSPSPRPAESP